MSGEDFYNTFVLTNPRGAVSGWVRKQVPAGSEGYFFRGAVNDHFIDTDLGRIGVGICQESYRCFLPRHLHENDVDLLLMPYSYPDLSASGGLESPPGSFTATWYARHLAIPVVTSNKTGVWPQVTGGHFPGRSAIVAHDTTVLAELDGMPDVAVAEVSLNVGSKPELELDCIGPFIPDLTLGSWWERRLTWLAVLLFQWFDADPDAALAQAYRNSEARRAAARQRVRGAEPAGRTAPLP